LGVTIARVGLGGVPLGCAIFMATCLLSTRRLLTGLNFIAILVSVVLFARIFGMTVDSTFPQNIRLVNAEIALLVVTGLGSAIELGRRAYLRRTHSNLQTAESL
jgi:uncharacterized membrane-anchored protein